MMLLPGGERRRLPRGFWTVLAVAWLVVLVLLVLNVLLPVSAPPH